MAGSLGGAPRPFNRGGAAFRAARTVDVVPLPRPRIEPSAIRKAIDELESSSKDDYHQSVNWLH